MSAAIPTYPALDARPLKDTICLFDVDETLTPARRVSALYSTMGSTDMSIANRARKTIIEYTNLNTV